MVGRAVPCQLNSRASPATAFDSARVTRAHGSAQGNSSTRSPHRGQSTRRGRYPSFKGSFRCVQVLEKESQIFLSATCWH